MSQYGSVLKVKGLTHAWKEQRVFSDVSFAVNAGETVGLVGPNGAGKSTLFSLILGLTHIQQGNVTYFDNLDLTSHHAKIFCRVGVVFQTLSLDKKLTVLENLQLAGSMFGLSSTHAKERAATLLHDAELPNKAVGQLSGGMQRRIDVLRALMHRPQFLILDEPTVGFDEVSFRKFWSFLKEVQSSQQMSIFLTTHRSDEAEQCNRLLLLAKGQLCFEGSPDSLRQNLASDILVLEPIQKDSSHINQVMMSLKKDFAVEPYEQQGSILIQSHQAHFLIPKIVEAVPVGTFQSVQIRRSSLADAFCKVTGEQLHAQN